MHHNIIRVILIILSFLKVDRHKHHKIILLKIQLSHKLPNISLRFLKQCIKHILCRTKVPKLKIAKIINNLLKPRNKVRRKDKNNILNRLKIIQITILLIILKPNNLLQGQQITSKDKWLAIIHTKFRTSQINLHNKDNFLLQLQAILILDKACL